MKLLMVYNFTTEEAHVDAPNFYRDCAEKVFPEFGVETTFLPNMRTHILFKLLTFLRIKDSSALTVVVIWWVFRNGHKFDIILGWVTNGVIAAILKDLMRWPRTRVCLILYKLPDNKKRGFISVFKRLLISSTSRGADLLLALDTSQADSFAKIFGRKPGTTCPLTYGVDTEWYDSRVQDLPSNSSMTIFCPGSAYRDDITLEKAVSNLNIWVKRFQLNNTGNFSVTTTTIGRAKLEKYFNAPYGQYISECRSAAMVVIAVANSDKPVGLTSLLECMCLGCPIIISRGASSRDYVIDGVTAILYEEGNWQELQEKIIYLFNHPEIAQQIGSAAREYAQRKFGLKTCGQQFFKKLHGMGSAECLT